MSEKKTSGDSKSTPYPVQQQAGGYPGPPPQQQPESIRPPVAKFDQTANVDPNKPINIPPPPPGYAPTDAQVAFQQGKSVQVTQEKKDMLGGGADGGVSIF